MMIDSPEVKSIHCGQKNELFTYRSDACGLHSNNVNGKFEIICARYQL